MPPAISTYLIRHGSGKSPRHASYYVDSTGHVFIAAGNAILKLMSGANPVVFAIVDSRPGAGQFTAEFDSPLRFTIDGADNLVVVDADHRTLRQIDRAGRTTTIAGASEISSWLDGPADMARFFNLHSVAVDRRGTIYAAELDSVQIQPRLLWHATAPKRSSGRLWLGSM